MVKKLFADKNDNFNKIYIPYENFSYERINGELVKKIKFSHERYFASIYNKYRNYGFDFILLDYSKEICDLLMNHNMKFTMISSDDKYFNVFLSRFSDPYYNHYKDLTFEDHRNPFHHITEEMKEYAKSNDIKLLFAGNTQLDANVIIVFPQLMIL